MDLFNQRIFTLHRVRNLLSDCAILDRPVEDAIFGGVVVLS